MKLYVGLDVHSKRTFYHVQDEEGGCVRKGATETSVEGYEAMLAELGPPVGTKVALETGTQAGWAWNVLKGLGMDPVVIEAGEVRRKARRPNQKTDNADAFEICDGLRRDIYVGIVWVPPAQIERLRAIVSRRRSFVRLRTSQINAARFLFRARGLSTAGMTLKNETSWGRLLARAEEEEMREYVGMHMAQWQLARQHIERLEEQLREAVEPFAEEMELLRTIPGVGPITAATFIAVIGDPGRFATSAKVASYIGLTPAMYDSGERERHGHITKRGSATLRSVLCEAAHQARRANHPLHPYFARVCAKSGYRKAVTAVAQRLARIMWAVWRKRRAFDLKRLNVVCDRKKITKTVYFRIKEGNKSAA